jgi:ankyrin repeat protein
VAFKGYDDIAALLLGHGADVDADNGGGMTPLMFAAMFGRYEVARRLQDHGASLKRRNRLGLTAGFMVGLSHGIARLFRRHRSMARALP